MKNLMILSIAGILLSGCTTGTVITKEGTTQEPKWHQVDKVIFNKKEGTFPNLQSLSEVKVGMTKDQLYELIGRPQYDDGWRPREWNYLFHFTTPGKGENNITTCQFKVLFDKNMLAGSFYWNPINPKNAICDRLSLLENKDTSKKIATKHYTLNADALFKFDKSAIQDVNTQDKVELDQFTLGLKSFKQLNSVQVTGYTDRLGDTLYNQKLSQERAESIKQYLVDQGINTNVITAQGKGAAEPIKICDNSLSKNQLIQCLAPNRRVVIDVDGYIQAQE